VTAPATGGTPGFGVTPSLDTIGGPDTEGEAARSPEGSGAGSTESE
jgi:hypothetical protein